MKIFCIGTTSYKYMMERYKKILESDGLDDARIPKFDDYDTDELQICKRNVEDIKWADEVHVFWDQRSMGTVFDFGAAFALDKKVKIIYMNPKTFANVMRWYEDPEVYRMERWPGEDGCPGPSAPF